MADHIADHGDDTAFLGIGDAGLVAAVNQPVRGQE